MHSSLCTHGWPLRRLLSGCTWLLLCISLTGVGQAMVHWDFTEVIANARDRYGKLGSGDQRIRAWGQLLQAHQGEDETAQLDAVNRFFNQQLSFRSDLQVWGRNDYWASPVESLVQGAGDCEDFAIAKYFSLRRLGVPSEKLRITYVKALRQNQPHMVLTYYSETGADPLVLDNLTNDIRRASQRRDLLPVYAFNADGVYLPRAGSERQAGDPKQLSRWTELLQKLQAEGFIVGQG